MKESIAASLTSLGSIPSPLAKRARRDRPMCVRLPERSVNSFVHAGLSGVLAGRWNGLNPLNFTAATKSDRMLLKVLPVRPAAAGLTAASLALIAGSSSGIRAGSSPTSTATRFIAEQRSRSRVSERALWPFRAKRTSMRVIWVGVAGPPREAYRLGLGGHGISFRFRVCQRRSRVAWG